jgi:hypothetical protein
MSGGARLECSVWSNGGTGWGVKILGGTSVREAHFDRKLSPVVVEIDGIDVPVNIDKKSFWTRTCGELLRKPFEDYFKRNGLNTGDRVWLEIIQPKRRFRLRTN